MYHSLETRIWFVITFLPLKESLTLFQTWVFCWSSIILSHLDLELLRIDFPNLTSSILMEIVTVLVALVNEFCFICPLPPAPPTPPPPPRESLALKKSLS